jgi:hypothetical protein
MRSTKKGLDSSDVALHLLCNLQISGPVALLGAFSASRNIAATQPTVSRHNAAHARALSAVLFISESILWTPATPDWALAFKLRETMVPQ